VRYARASARLPALPAWRGIQACRYLCW
jgi:hypothetical protein